MMRASVFGLCILLAPLQGWAQYYNSLTGRQFGNMYAANADRIMSQMIQQSGYQAMRNSIEAQARGQAAPAPTPAAAASGAPRATLAASDFKPAGRRDVPEQLAQGVADATERGQVAAAARDIHKAIEAAPGFRRNNVAAAMTVVVGVSVQVVSGREIADADSQPMMLAFNDELAASEAFRGLNAQRRTRMYDTFVILGGFIAGIAQAGQETNDEKLKAQARQMARDALLQFGVKT